jgi:hypothetical protein
VRRIHVAQLTVIDDVCKKYTCACAVKTATKPPQPIEKSTAGASLLAQVIVGKMVDSCASSNPILDKLHDYLRRSKRKYCRRARRGGRCVTR